MNPVQIGQQPMITAPQDARDTFVEGKAFSTVVKGLGAVSSGMLAHSLKGTGTKWPTALWITSGVMALLAGVDAYNLNKNG